MSTLVQFSSAHTKQGSQKIVVSNPIAKLWDGGGGTFGVVGWGRIRVIKKKKNKEKHVKKERSVSANKEKEERHNAKIKMMWWKLSEGWR